MVAPTTPTLTFEPSTPTPVEDGVLYAVTGPVPVLAHIELTDGEGRIRGKSPQFRQTNKLQGPSDAEAFVLEVTGSPGGGNYKLKTRSTIEHGNYETTADIAYNANAAAIEDALEALVGAGNVAVVDGEGDTVVVTFGGDAPIKGMSLALADNDLTGGTSPTVEITRTSAGLLGLEEVAGGPYFWGPVYVPKNTSIVADLVADEDGEMDEYDVYEGDSLLDAAVTVYDYGDL